MPLDVSVIIPAYRAESTIGRALRSVAAQTAPPAPPGPPVVNATPPPLPPDPALGAHATQNQGDSQQGRRQRNR